MSRFARIITPGCFYHITQRGNHRQTVFDSDCDREYYLSLVEKYSIKFGTMIYAFCLMTNHVNYIASPETPESFAKSFSIAHMRYAQYLNRRRRTDGHLWQGRFFSEVMEEGHFLSAVRYIENNPVRAGLVERAWEWTWSSAREHCGEREENRRCLTLADIRPFLSEYDCKSYLV